MKIVNITATVQMEREFDLDSLVNSLPNAEMSIQWVKLRMPPKNNYVAFYPSGKFLITGVKSNQELNEVAENVVIFLKEHEIDNNIKGITINNYVLIDKLDFEVNLDDLIVKLDSTNATYEPEQFIGLSFKDENNITFTLFHSGKINITGVKSLENLEEKINSFKQLIYNKSFNE